MDWTIALLLVLVIAISLALMWRPPRGRRRTVDEALASDELRKEQEAAMTEATYRADRFNVPGRGRKR
jgi:membrane protein implicated in regulation of membrane protease activity